MSEMIERVARAIEEARDEYEPDNVAMARAALQAAREYFNQSPEFHWAAIEAIDESLK